MEKAYSDRKKILILENSIDVTGSLKSILSSSSMMTNEFEFIFVLPTNALCTTYVRNNGFRVLELPFKEISKSVSSWIVYFPFLLMNFFSLKKLVKEWKIDLLIVNDFYNLLPCVFKLLGGNIPYICFVRFIPDRFPKVLARFWEICHRKFAIEIIAVSNVVKNQLKFKEKLKVIYDGLSKLFDVSESSRADASNLNTLLYLSNYIEGKGQEFALRSFGNIATKYPTWKLRFVGGDMGKSKNKAYKQSLIELAKVMKIERQVEWAGFAEDVINEYTRATIVLNFSNSESFSLTCFEAMAIGRAVISTNSGGPAEMIEPNKSGMLVPVGDVSAMTDAIEYLITNPAIREEIGANAFLQVREKFSYDNTIAKLRMVYLKAMVKTQ
jgi:L-malate glycosyltransferase